MAQKSQLQQAWNALPELYRTSLDYLADISPQRKGNGPVYLQGLLHDGANGLCLTTFDEEDCRRWADALNAAANWLHQQNNKEER